VTAVEAIDITKRYGATTALADAGIHVRHGETHALVGRNGAGKSTLVAILTGLQKADAGEVSFDGEPAPPLSDRDAWRQLVACVYQKSTIIPALTVAENLFLNRQQGRLGVIDWRGMRRRAADLLDRYGVAIDPAAVAGDLTVEQSQLVEIARALSFGARFIILDEPTARLDGAAIDRLFERMRDLQAAGVTFLFISHHLQEVYEVCQTVTVFRDARHVLTSPVADLPQEALVRAMTGDSVASGRAADRPAIGADTQVALEVDGLTLADFYHDFTVRVKAGELVGLVGSGSSGKVAVAETIAGLRTADSGTVTVAGRRPRPGSVPASLEAGLGYLPQDRHREGLVPLLSVAENATMTIADRFGPAGVVLAGRQRAAAGRMIAEYDIRTEGPDQPVNGLSGGNAQKVVLARALASDPKAVVLVSPTAGVDVRSRQSLLGAVADTAAAGTAVLIVSDELDDVRDCDRVLVMFHGRVVDEKPRGWTDAEMVAAVEGVPSAEEKQT